MASPRTDAKVVTIIKKDEKEEERLDAIRHAHLPSIYCPITHSVFVEPVVTPSGQTYEFTPEFKKEINKNHKDPMTREDVFEDELVKNWIVKKIIDEYNQNVLIQFDNLKKENELLKNQSGEKQPDYQKLMSELLSTMPKEMLSLKQKLDVKDKELIEKEKQLAETKQQLDDLKKQIESFTQKSQEIFLKAKKSLDIKDQKTEARVLDIHQVEFDRQFALSLYASENIQSGSPNRVASALFVPANLGQKDVKQAQLPRPNNSATGIFHGPAVGLSINEKFMRAILIKDFTNASAHLLNGADVNYPDMHGNTALHLAAIKNDLNSVNFLLANGADPFIQNDDGLIPVDVLRSSNPVTFDKTIYKSLIAVAYGIKGNLITGPAPNT